MKKYDVFISYFRKDYNEIYVSIADKFKKTILPVRIDDAPYSSVIEYDLIGVDYIDYSKRSNESLEKLRKSILARLLISDTLAAL